MINATCNVTPLLNTIPISKTDLPAVQSALSLTPLQPLVIPKPMDKTVLPLQLQSLTLKDLRLPQPLFSKTDLQSSNCEGQQRLLKHATENDLDAIVQVHTNILLPFICDTIKQGKWQELLDTYGKDKQIGYLLLAAYCRKDISLEDLATAMMMVGAFQNSPAGAVKVVRVGQSHYSMFQDNKLLDRDKSEKAKTTVTIERIRSVAENQKVIMLVELDSFDPKTRDLIDESFTKDDKTLGIRKYKFEKRVYLGIASFGLLNKFFTETARQRGSKRCLTPMLHLVPERKQMEAHLLEGLSPIALLLPDEKPKIHNTKNNVIALPHDCYHEIARLRRAYWADKAILFAQIAEKEVAKLGQEVFKDPLKILKILRQKSAPTEAQIVFHVLDRLCDQLVDGLFEVYENVPRFQIITSHVLTIIMKDKKDAMIHYPKMPFNQKTIFKSAKDKLMPAFKTFYETNPGFLEQIQEPLFAKG
ncbi:MAG: hypothetical protein Q8K75_09680 [Chlamydiales bacterium]|nr:hypothetical protein [Chlamydiales bacterium]